MSKENKKEWDCKVEDARREYEKALKEYEGARVHILRGKSQKEEVKVKIKKKKSQHLLGAHHPSCCQGS